MKRMPPNRSTSPAGTPGTPVYCVNAASHCVSVCACVRGCGGVCVWWGCVLWCVCVLLCVCVVLCVAVAVCVWDGVGGSCGGGWWVGGGGVSLRCCVLYCFMYLHN